MEDPVVKTCGKDLDNFQGKSTASIGWFNIYHEWLKTFSTIYQDFYKKLLNLILKVKILKHIKPL